MFSDTGLCTGCTRPAGVLPHRHDQAVDPMFGLLMFYPSTHHRHGPRTPLTLTVGARLVMTRGSWF